MLKIARIYILLSHRNFLKNW